jgi:hypothetical protein
MPLAKSPSCSISAIMALSLYSNKASNLSFSIPTFGQNIFSLSSGSQVIEKGLLNPVSLKSVTMLVVFDTVLKSFYETTGLKYIPLKPIWQGACNL